MGSHSFAPGESVGGCTLECVLGEGGMATVWKAANSENRTESVALKILRLGNRTKEERDGIIRRFKQEVLLARRCGPHVNLIEVFSDGESQDVPYAVMEYVDGYCLTDFLHSRIQAAGLPALETQKDLPSITRSDPVVPEEQALDIGIQLAEVLEHLHRQDVVHRDIKPENVMLGRLPDSRWIVKLTDFGLAGMVDEEGARRAGLTQTNESFGTPLYMPIEMFNPVLDADGRRWEPGPWTDVYGVSLILFILLTGQLPYGNRGQLAAQFGALAVSTEVPDPASLVTGLDPALAAVIRKGMAKNPWDRYLRMEEITKALRSFLATARALSDVGEAETILRSPPPPSSSPVPSSVKPHLKGVSPPPGPERPPRSIRGSSHGNGAPILPNAPLPDPRPTVNGVTEEEGSPRATPDAATSIRALQEDEDEPAPATDRRTPSRASPPPESWMKRHGLAAIVGMVGVTLAGFFITLLIAHRFRSDAVPAPSHAPVAATSVRGVHPDDGTVPAPVPGPVPSSPPPPASVRTEEATPPPAPPVEKAPVASAVPAPKASPAAPVASVSAAAPRPRKPGRPAPPPGYTPPTHPVPAPASRPPSPQSDRAARERQLAEQPELWQ